MDDDDVNRLRIAFGRISRTVDRQVSGDSMTRTQLSVLSTVAHRGSVGIGELAEYEGLNPTMLSRVVGKLEARALVERVPAPSDKRSVVVAITLDGSRLHDELRRQRSALLTAYLRDVAPAQLAALQAAIPALETLAAAMRSTSGLSTGVTP